VEGHEAAQLIEAAVQGTEGIWADLGCGDGTFTLALREMLGPSSRIYAVDRDARALSALGRRTASATGIIPVTADFTRSLDLPVHVGVLDGILLANSLHYVENPEHVLRLWTDRLRPEGRAVFVEYDRRAASRWVPYPIPPARLIKLAAVAGLSPPVITATQPSEFTGSLYAAYATKPRRDPRATAGT
jgi:SAM-dependent methyltransferase